MRSKFLVLSLLITTSCGLRIGEKPPPNTDISTSGTQYSCVGKIAQRTVDYLDAKMSDQEITEFIGCLQNAFMMFSEKFHGEKERDSFSPEEIRRFLQEKFLPRDRVITPKLLRQFMIVKQALVGGGADVIRRSDLVSVIGILDKFKREAIRLRPFVPILNSKLVEFQSSAELENRISAADRALQTSVETFAQILAESQTSYSFSDFEELLQEFRKFTNWEEHFVTTRSAHSWVQFLRAFKSMTVSPNTNVILPTEWVPLLRSSYQWYLNFIRFEVGVKNKPILQGNGFANFIKLSDDLQSLVYSAVRNQPKRIITFDQLDLMIDALKGLNWFPETLRAQSLKEALHALVSKILGPEMVISGSRSSEDVSRGIDTLTLGEFSTQFAQWEQVQLALQERYSDSQIPREPLNIRVPRLNIPLQIGKSPFDRSGWHNFIQQFQDGRVLFKDGIDRVFLVEKSRLQAFNVENGFYNLSRMNMIRSLMGLIFRGYYFETGKSNIAGVKVSPGAAALESCEKEQKPDSTMDDLKKCLGRAVEINPSYPSSLGLTKEAVQAFYKDFYWFGADLGFIDSRVKNAGERTFKEAKVFTYSADGVDEAHPMMSFSQAIEESAYVFSAGALSSDLYQRMLVYCNKGPRDDLNGLKKMERACVRIHLVPELIDLIKTMPYYTAYLRNLNTDQALEYADSLLTAAFSKFSKEDPLNVEHSEFATIAMVIHYAETLMTNYNADLDDYLSEDEIRRAAPTFRGYVLEEAKKKGINIPIEGIADEAFMFILKFKRLPETPRDKDDIIRHYGLVSGTGAVAGAACTAMTATGLKSLCFDGMKWGIRMDRSDIAKVFSMLVQTMSGADEGKKLLKHKWTCLPGDYLGCSNSD